MHALLKNAIPTSARRAVRSAVDAAARAERAAILDAIPRRDLGPEHLANLRVLPTRLDLLRNLPRDAVAAEIGVSRGKFTRAIMELNPPRSLHLVDVWGSARYNEDVRREVLSTFAGDIAEGQIEIHRGYSTAVAPTFAPGSFDWIYIDTDHSYETTRDELEAFAPAMKADGIIAGHDYSMGNWRDGIKYGVIEAVHEFCVTRGWEMLFVTTELTTNPSFAIRRLREV